MLKIIDDDFKHIEILVIIKKMPEFRSAQSAFNAATMMSVTWGDYCSFGGHNDSVITMMTMLTNGH